LFRLDITRRRADGYDPSSSKIDANNRAGAARLEFIRELWSALLERHERAKLRARLCDLSDKELLDIGIARGEIDYVATCRSADPRGNVQPK
jgi:uncharacterized protein YjiS (DUF1127 family)